MTNKNKNSFVQEQEIDGTALRNMMLFGGAQLDKNKAYIDELNVFPVPDGDTGTNMSMTMNAATKELGKYDASDNRAGTIADVCASGALRGARGNSGVILSQILRGIAKGLDGKQTVTALQWATALQVASDSAYKAVLKPKEGTILTVIRYVAQKAMDDAKRGNNIYKVIDNMVFHGETILAQTPEMLPVLKEANVVDSGGAGLVMIFRGFKSFLDGDMLDEIATMAVAPIKEETKPKTDSHDFAILNGEAEIPYGYCTEFFVEHFKKKVTKEDTEKLLESLQSFGDSVVVVNDDDLIKVHIHTDMPGKALQMALRLGELNGIKIENMREQNRQLLQERKENEKECGMVAISAGSGLETIFRNVGVDVVVSGGQTMNPSAEDIENAVRRANARNVFVLPNNKNILLAAKQAAKAFDKKSGIKVYVIPTETVTEGIAVAAVFRDEGTPSKKEKAMKQVLKQVVSGAITYAVRKTTVKGRSIAKDDYIGMVHGDIVENGAIIDDVVDGTIKAMLHTGEKEFISIYYGEEVETETAQALKARLELEYPDMDIDLQFGGQPLYYYFMSAE